MLLVTVAVGGQEPVVSYEIDVSLDPDTHRLTGSESVRWSNTGGVPTSELWWHLYLNAFAGTETTFMKEMARGGFRGEGVPDGGWGWVRVTRLALTDGTDLLPEFEFVRPDDDNAEDYTVARVALPREVPPGAAVELELEFEAQLPRIVARTGYAGDFHLVGQWFPKLAVFQGEQGWNSHQFHATSEFFADFGSYRVAVNVPRSWVVGATGVEVERETSGDGQRLVFAADRVHDFAWTAAPHTLMTVVESDFEPGRDVPLVWLDRARRLLGLSAAELELPPMHVRLLLPRGQRFLADRMLLAVRRSVAWFGLHYGPYPYPQLTVVSPPPTAGQAGGMEYPTFMTTGARLAYVLPVIRRLPRIESLTVHEFGHQYFQGLLASNESEQGWLDEGLNSYAEAECMEAMIRDGLTPVAELGGPWGRTRAFLRAQRLPTVADQEPRVFRSYSDYIVASFARTPAALKTLEGLVGRERFAVAMRTYVDRFRFRHPTGEDLFSVLEEVTGTELGWFFEQAFVGDAEADWTLLTVRNRRRRPPSGFEWDGQRWTDLPSGEEDPEGWTVLVEVGRRGEFVGPVEVSLRFADGSEERRTWDGRDRWVRWQFPSAQRVVQVVVDPDGVWALETDRVDNYWRDEPDATAARRRMWWLVDALQLLGLIHLSWS
jgi:hypothetical protein